MQPYIKRALEPVVAKFSEHFKVVVLTGPRQVGKTTMLRRLAQEELERTGVERAYISLDDTSICMAAKSDPALFFQRYKPPMLIDEIQKAPELLPYIKLEADRSGSMGQFWLTGSQPFHLMKEVSESLAGRAAVLEMLGLSNSEIAGVASEPYDPGPEYFIRRASSMPSFEVGEAFERILAGSLPGIRALPPELRPAAYESYIDTYLMRDIRDLAQVADELKFRRFLAACASLTSKPVVYAQLARLADIDEKTAKSWLSLLVSSYLVKIVQPYSNNLIKRLNKQPILHFTDVGLAAYLSGWRDAGTLELGAMSGMMFETYAFSEIYKSYCNAGMNPMLWFFRTNDRKEIDLLIERDGALCPVEVKKSATPVAADAKNFGALDPVADDEVAPELSAFKRKIGCGSIVCMASDAYPVGQRVWSMPLWAV